MDELMRNDKPAGEGGFGFIFFEFHDGPEGSLHRKERLLRLLQFVFVAFGEFNRALILRFFAREALNSFFLLFEPRFLLLGETRNGIVNRVDAGKEMFGVCEPHGKIEWIKMKIGKIESGPLFFAGSSGRRRGLWLF